MYCTRFTAGHQQLHTVLPPFVTYATRPSRLIVVLFYFVLFFFFFFEFPVYSRYHSIYSDNNGYAEILSDSPFFLDLPLHIFKINQFIQSQFLIIQGLEF